MSVYSSLDEAVLAVEGIDVDDGIYRVFDSRGRRITLRASGVHRGWLGVNVGTVQVGDVEVQPTGEADLRQLLLHYLRNRGLPVTESFDLAALVEVAKNAA